MRVGVVTGSRAEYGILFWLLKKLNEDAFFQLQLYVTGMHLSPEFGLTYQEIEKDGFVITKKIETLLSGDSSVAVAKSIGLGIISFSESFVECKPDLVIVIGDRTEMFAAATAAFIANIPIAHLHGGETTYGVYDDALRHAITKMSIFHFTSTESYRNRVIQMGEQPESVFNVGALSIEGVKNTIFLNRGELEKELNVILNNRNFLITFHPVTLENSSSSNQFSELLNALDVFRDTSFFFTYPNSDKNSRILIKQIHIFIENHTGKAYAFKSLGQTKYLSLMKIADVVIGNSSSGIVDTPILKKPTVNIGDRQTGRIFTENIFTCNTKRDEIVLTINKALDYHPPKENINPYGSGNTSTKIIKILKSIRKLSLKKTFYDFKQSDSNKILQV